MLFSALFRRLFGPRRPLASFRDDRVEPLESRIALTGGFVDPTFGTSGIATQDFGTASARDDGAEAVAVQADGKTVVAGFAQRGATDFDFLVARYNRDGTLDTTFNSPNGFRFVAFDLGGTFDDRARAIALQPDGGILVAGLAATATGTDFAIARLTDTGMLDTSFDGDGRATVAFNLGGTNNDVANDLVVQSDGKIVVVGSTITATGLDFGVARLKIDGTPDLDFDTDGRDSYPVNLGGTNNDTAEAVALSGDKIVVAGTAATGATVSEAAILVLTSAGVPDPAFGGTGTVVIRYGNTIGIHTAKDVAVQPDGAIVVVGEADNPSGTDSNFGIARLTPAGSLDPTFNGFGRRAFGISATGSREDSAEAVLIQPDGKIVVAGTSNVDFGQGASDDFFGLRLKADGSSDGTYNFSGVRLYDIVSGGISEDTARAVALSADGIVFAGHTLSAANGTDVAVLRVERDDWLVVAEAAKGSTVSVFTPTGTLLYEFESFPVEFTGGVRVATADITGDGCPDFFVAPAKGGGPVVRVFDGFTFELLREIPVLAPGYKGGVHIAVADVLDPSNAVELIVSPGKKFAPRVEIYDPTTIATPLKSFDAYAANFKGGVRLAPIQSVGSGRFELAVGPQSGAQPVKIFDVNATTPTELESVLPFGAKFKGGVFLSTADVEGNGLADLFIGTGKGKPRIKIFIPATDALADEFNPFGPGFTGGAQVSSGNFTGFGSLVAAVASKGGRPVIQFFEPDTDNLLTSFQPFGPTSKTPISALLVER